MKIVYVYDAIARIGGVERILVDKMNYLAEVYGYEIYLITAAQGKHPFSFPLSDKVKHVDINARFHLQYQYGYPKRIWVKWQMDHDFKCRLQKEITMINPDIIIGTTYYKANVICRLKCRAKKVIESHCVKTYTGSKDGIKRNVLIQILHDYLIRKSNHIVEKKSDAIISLTYKDIEKWKKNEKQKFVIPNSIKEISASASSCTIPRVISAGRLTYEKGFDRLIKSWRKVYERHPDWKLDIYGDGAEKENLLHLILSLGLKEVITIYPFTTNIFKEYINSSIYVLPSNYEGFGLVLIEAMACGIPCVSFDCPYGPSEIIRNKEDGILVENNNTEQLTAAINYLIENGKMRQKYGENAQKNAKRFLSDEIMKQWNNLLKQIV